MCPYLFESKAYFSILTKKRIVMIQYGLEVDQNQMDRAFYNMTLRFQSSCKSSEELVIQTKNKKLSMLLPWYQKDN